MFFCYCVAIYPLLQSMYVACSNGYITVAMSIFVFKWTTICPFEDKNIILFLFVALYFGGPSIYVTREVIRKEKVLDAT